MEQIEVWSEDSMVHFSQQHFGQNNPDHIAISIDQLPLLIQWLEEIKKEEISDKSLV